MLPQPLSLLYNSFNYSLHDLPMFVIGIIESPSFILTSLIKIFISLVIHKHRNLVCNNHSLITNKHYTTLALLYYSHYLKKASTTRTKNRKEESSL